MMDYQNKKKFAKKIKRKRERDAMMRRRREQHNQQKSVERGHASLVYKYRERLIPLRKVKEE